MPVKEKRVWVIEGRTGSEVFFRRTLPIGSLSEAEVVTLLKRLASRHSTASEVLGASVRRNSAHHVPLLEVIKHTSPNRFHLATNLDPHYTARAEVDRGLINVDEA